MRKDDGEVKRPDDDKTFLPGFYQHIEKMEF
jgi:hypothetical protein